MYVQRSLLATTAFSVGAAISSTTLSTAAHAQDTTRTLPEISVTAAPFGADETAQILAPARVLTDDELRDKLGTSLGETLANEPGVSTTAFGAGASRPVIRGLGGPRVRVLQNGMGVADVSAISADHAVGADPYSARQIEILRGPAALLYGSGAAGGVVNLVNERIPTALEPVPTGEVEARYGTADRARSLAFAVDGSAGNIGLHVDGSLRSTNNYRIPGYADRSDLASASGRLPNSSTRPHSIGVGASLVQDWGHIGASVARLENRYGIPSEEGARIGMEQTRTDVDALVNAPFAGFDYARIKLGHTDYTHTEFDTDGVPENDFSNRTLETRWELGHAEIAGWRGVLGVQTEHGNFAAVSREPGHPATVPATRSRSQALFMVEERDFASTRLHAGARIESVKREPDAGTRRSFSLASYSIGAAWRGVLGYSFGPTFSVAQRAPATEELYSSGAHHATETYDRGDPTLRKETSRNIELTLQKNEGALRWRVNLFRNQVRNFIYGQMTGVTLDEDGNPGAELDERIYLQNGATVRGAEAEISYNQHGPGLSLRAFADTSRARLDAGGGYLPLQPATRVGTEIGYRSGAWRTSASVLHARRQDRTAAFESATPGYTRVDASLSYTHRHAASRITWFALVKNLLDEDIRLSTSLLKDTAPLAGRSLVLGVRTLF